MYLQDYCPEVNKTNCLKFNVYNNNISIKIKNCMILSFHNNKCEQLSECNCIEIKELTELSI